MKDLYVQIFTWNYFTSPIYLLTQFNTTLDNRITIYNNK